MPKISKLPSDTPSWVDSWLLRAMTRDSVVWSAVGLCAYVWYFSTGRYVADGHRIHWIQGECQAPQAVSLQWLAGGDALPTPSDRDWASYERALQSAIRAATQRKRETVYEIDSGTLEIRCKAAIRAATERKRTAVAHWSAVHEDARRGRRPHDTVMAKSELDMARGIRPAVSLSDAATSPLVDAQYLLDAVTRDRVEIRYGAALDAVVVASADRRAIIMPRRRGTGALGDHDIADVTITSEDHYHADGAPPRSRKRVKRTSAARRIVAPDPSPITPSAAAAIDAAASAVIAAACGPRLRAFWCPGCGARARVPLASAATACQRCSPVVASATATVTLTA